MAGVPESGFRRFFSNFSVFSFALNEVEKAILLVVKIFWQRRDFEKRFSAVFINGFWEIFYKSFFTLFFKVTPFLSFPVWPRTA